jgi:hypothetical protein
LPLTWKDIDFKERTIFIKWDKNSFRRIKRGMKASRKICLPPESHMALKLLYTTLLLDGSTPGPERFKIPKEFLPPNGWIFIGAKGAPMTGEGFEEAFQGVRERAVIDLDVDPKERLTPHCLRAEAMMQFRRCEVIWSEKEIDIMMNGPKSHYDVQHDYLPLIQAKLDTEVFGKPWDELSQEERWNITGGYPAQHGLSIEDVFKLGDWLFGDLTPSYHQDKSA